jgi:hypothetical protein
MGDRAVKRIRAFDALMDKASTAGTELAADVEQVLMPRIHDWYNENLLAYSEEQQEEIGERAKGIIVHAFRTAIATEYLPAENPLDLIGELAERLDSMLGMVWGDAGSAFNAKPLYEREAYLCQCQMLVRKIVGAAHGTEFAEIIRE